MDGYIIMVRDGLIERPYTGGMRSHGICRVYNKVGANRALGNFLPGKARVVHVYIDEIVEGASSASPLVYYQSSGAVFGAPAHELAQWYADCYRRGDFSADPPGEPTNLLHFEHELHEYDDPEGFFETLRAASPNDDQLEEIIDAFDVEFDV